MAADVIAGDSDHGESTESDTNELGNEPANARRQHDIPANGERVEWSEDEDAGAAYSAFKGRKTLKRKRKPEGNNQTVEAIRSTKPVGVVGRRPRKTAAQQNSSGRPPRKEQKNHGSDSDSQDQLLDELLPEYLKARRTDFEDRRARLREAGLKLPPDYDDLYFSDDERMGDLREKPAFSTITPCGKYADVTLPYSAGMIPAPIAQWLRGYQIEGAQFLHELFVFQKGGILGDDMGLGKTIQVIAFLTAAFGKTGDERDAKRMRKVRRADDRWFPRVLIICPGSLMENWKAELQRWGWWQVDVFHGAPDVKEAALQAAGKGRLEIMITTYTTYRINKGAINMVDWDCVVADECHIIKGRSSEITQAMNEINALCRIGLTGTAIQNKYEELWTLLNWTNPGRFGSVATWKTSISEPLKMGQAHDATVAQLAKARKTATALVNNLLPQFFLRRMKSLIADQLPKKSDRVVFCPLTETQAEAYENYVNSDVIEYIRTSSDMCDCGSGKKAGWCCRTHIPGRGRWQNSVFPSIVTLQKLANHIAMLIPTSSDMKEKQDKDLENLQIALPNQWKELYSQKDSIMTFMNPDFCGKWKILRKLLHFWHGNGDKVLIFSHSVRLLKMLHMLFTSTTSYSISYLDGSMSYEERARTVDDFNADPTQFVFLISTRAGGVGLNITSANKVVIVDPNWNPSYDLQAQDRAYRIGQTRDVEVFRLVSAGTIEEIVYARQIYKQQQANIAYNASLERRYFRGVQDQKEKKGEIFGLQNLFSFQDDKIMLRDIVNKTNVAESRAGVSVIGLDVDTQDAVDLDDDDPFKNEDDEDPGLSQLAALVADEAGKSESSERRAPPKKTDAILAILAGAGVQYTHENSEVIGTSKIESRLSRRAIESGNNVDESREVMFPLSQEAHVEVASDGRGRSFGSGVEGVGSDGGDESVIRYRYHPPEDVRRRQFCTMAKTFQFADPTEFALVVEGWSQAQRRNCLDKFYNVRRAKPRSD